jgi:hypothetical protein
MVTAPAVHYVLALATPPATEPANNVPQLLMVVGVLMIGFLMVISVRSRIARRNAGRPSPEEHIAKLKAAARHREDHEAIRADLHATAQTLASQITLKANYLEQLIADADDRIARLRNARNGIFDEAPPSLRSDEHHDQEDRGGNGDQSDFPHDARDVPTSHHAEPTEYRPARDHDRTLDPLTRSVYELADDGHDALGIAQALDEQIGKVELILALRGAG